MSNGTVAYPGIARQMRDALEGFDPAIASLVESAIAQSPPVGSPCYEEFVIAQRREIRQMALALTYSVFNQGIATLARMS